MGLKLHKILFHFWCKTKQFNHFVSKLVSYNDEKGFFTLLWNKFSEPVRMIIDIMMENRKEGW